MTNPNQIDLSPRRFTVTRYEREIGHLIEPNRYRCPLVAAEMADRLLLVHREIPGSIGGVVIGLRKFFDWLTLEPNAATLDLGSVTASHIQRWEQGLFAEQRVAQSHGPYDNFVNVRALFLRISQTDPSALNDTVHKLLASPTVTILPEMRPVEGLPPFTHEEHRQIVKAAYRDVEKSMTLLNAGDVQALGRSLTHAIPALHVLLSAGTGEPPEVLRGITIADVHPLLPGAMTSHADTEAHQEWLMEAVLDRPPSYCVELRKLRAHELRTTFINREDRYSCYALEASLRISEPFRARDRSQALWIDPDGRQSVFNQSKRLAHWLEHHHIQVSGKPAFGRFRKRVVGAEAMADPAAYLALARRHRAPTFFRSYVNNPALRAHGAGDLVSSITEAFDEAIGPRVIPTAQAAAIRDKEDLIEGMSNQMVDALMSGELAGPHAACIDPTSSPFARAGSVCGSAASGLCFICPNAVVMEDHLPALVFFADYLDPNRYGDLDAWTKTWQPVWESVTVRILPKFDHSAIAEARNHVDEVFVDLGVRQDIGALEVEE